MKENNFLNDLDWEIDFCNAETLYSKYQRFKVNSESIKDCKYDTSNTTEKSVAGNPAILTSPSAQAQIFLQEFEEDLWCTCDIHQNVVKSVKNKEEVLVGSSASHHNENSLIGTRNSLPVEGVVIDSDLHVPCKSPCVKIGKLGRKDDHHCKNKLSSDNNERRSHSPFLSWAVYDERRHRVVPRQIISTSTSVGASRRNVLLAPVVATANRVSTLGKDKDGKELDDDATLLLNYVDTAATATAARESLQETSVLLPPLATSAPQPQQLEQQYIGAKNNIEIQNSSPPEMQTVEEERAHVYMTDACTRRQEYAQNSLETNTVEMLSSQFPELWWSLQKNSGGALPLLTQSVYESMIPSLLQVLQPYS